jgi:polyferredoxin
MTSRKRAVGRTWATKVLGWCVRIASLGVFLILLITGNERFWLPLLLAGIFTGPFLRRWYCRFVCPVSCVAACARSIRRRDKAAPPTRFTRGKKTSRAVWLALLALAFLVCLILGLRVRLFAWISAAGIAFAIFAAQGFWCGYFCPWGAAMQGMARMARLIRR